MDEQNKIFPLEAKRAGKEMLGLCRDSTKDELLEMVFVLAKDVVREWPTFKDGFEMLDSCKHEPDFQEWLKEERKRLDKGVINSAHQIVFSLYNIISKRRDK